MLHQRSRFTTGLTPDHDISGPEVVPKIQPVDRDRPVVDHGLQARPGGRAVREQQRPDVVDVLSHRCAGGVSIAGGESIEDRGVVACRRLSPSGDHPEEAQPVTTSRSSATSVSCVTSQRTANAVPLPDVAASCAAASGSRKIEIGDDDISAVFVEQRGSGIADSLAATGHDSHPTDEQVHHHHTTFIRLRHARRAGAR
jgi:hypothetical protein